MGYKGRLSGEQTGFRETCCEQITICLAVKGAEWGGANGPRKGGQESQYILKGIGTGLGLTWKVKKSKELKMMKSLMLHEHEDEAKSDRYESQRRKPTFIHQ